MKHLIIFLFILSSCIPTKELVITDRFGTQSYQILAPKDLKTKVEWKKGNLSLHLTSDTCPFRCHGWYGINVYDYKIINYDSTRIK